MERLQRDINAILEQGENYARDIENKDPEKAARIRKQMDVLKVRQVHCLPAAVRSAAERSLFVTHLRFGLHGNCELLGTHLSNALFISAGEVEHIKNQRGTKEDEDAGSGSSDQQLQKES